MRQAAWAFTGTFRPYQQRILDRSLSLASDHKLHVVAAPGSGKTILGLELAGRLGAPTLVLSPSLAIRDQWVQRLQDNFASPADGVTQQATLLPNTSVSLRSPAFLTSSTYQSLFAAYSQAVDQETGESFQDADLVTLLAGVATVVLDEAHHLRASWHRALVALLDQLRALTPDLCVISLTATPPYDSTPSEWQRYEQLCGPIDAEISVPELIYSGDLAPHQDYVLINEPTAAESAQLTALRAGTHRVLAALSRHPADGPAPLELLERSAVICAPEEHVDECLDDETGAVGLLHLLRYVGIDAPPVLSHLLDVGGWQASLEDGLQFVLSHPDLFDPGFSEAVRRELAAEGLFGSRGVINRSEMSAHRILLNSVGKLDSIARVVVHEARQLGEDLRLLVLTDHIRADALGQVGTQDPLVKLGVVPAFEAIRRALSAAGLADVPPAAMSGQYGSRSGADVPPAAMSGQYGSRSGADVPPAAPTRGQYGSPASDTSRPAFGQQLAVLSGSCVIVPTALIPKLRQLAQNERSALSVVPFPACPRYAQATFVGGSKVAVRVLTAAFARGLVTVLVGTAALLGEGWDCPQLNTLVLASTVKATMMTNQMRGRAIRVDPGAPLKVANVWHLATADADQLLSSRGEKTRFSQSHDVAKLARRFETFVGPHATQARVESGLARCASRAELWEKRTAAPLNADNLARAVDRDAVRALWGEAIARHDVNSPTGLDLSLEVEATVRPTKVVSALDLLFAVLEGAGFTLAFRLADSARAGQAAWLAVLAALTLTVLVGAAWALRALVWRRFYDPRRRVLAQANALLAALSSAGMVGSDTARVRVSVGDADFKLRVLLTGATPREQAVFAQCITELFGPVRGPRYLLAPAHWALILSPVLVQNVPSVLATRREHVEVFVVELARRGLRMRAHYTRTDQGRALLARARKAAAVNVAAALTRTKRVLSVDRV